MDNQHKREAFPIQQGTQSSSLSQSSNVPDQLRRAALCHPGSSKSNELNKRPPGASIPHPYNLPFPGVLYGPRGHLYPRTMLPIPAFHPGIPVQAGYQPPITGLNPLLSSNDNNNCNRGRAASHSTAIEMQHHSMAAATHLPFTLYPTYLPHPYLNLHRNHHPTLETPHTMHRRNSTNTTLPHPRDLYIPPSVTGPELHPTTTTLPLSTSQLPYPVGAHAPYLSYLCQSSQASHQLSLRRDRYSIGGPLVGNDATQRTPEHFHRRRNSIPTALEVQQISDESTENSSSIDDDDDDVFDSAPPVATPHSATDAASYLEQLRETRKRALSSGIGTSQAKYPCRDLPSDSSANVLPRARFRGRTVDADDDPNASDDQKTQKQTQVVVESTSERDVSDIPGTSSTVQTFRSIESDVVNRQSHQIPMHSNTSQKDCDQPSTLSNQPSSASRIPVLQTTSSAMGPARNSTPSPSILKKSKIRLNRHNLTPADGVQGSKGESSTQSTPEVPRTKSLPVKKQVAFKDDVKPTQPSQSDCDVILTPMKHDLLTEQNLTLVKKNPSAFTAKDKIGPYIFGPQLGTSPVRSIAQYLVRKENTFQYYMAKVLNMGGKSADDRGGRMLLFSEHSLLTLLRNHPGVVKERGFYKDVAFNPKTGQFQERLCLILDCLTPHEFDPLTEDYLNLQQHVIKVKRLTERETIRIFTSIVNEVLSLHKLNVVHRDLKLGNMVLLKKSQRVVLTNFCLGRHLISDGELLKDQRGSPAYISPDVLSSKPYAGKPSDMWSLGVVLYMMLYGQFPFYDKEPSKLFRKIKKADFVIPSNNFQTSTQINDIIRGLLTLDPSRRLTASETITALQQCSSSWAVLRYPSQELQVVPDLDSMKESSSDSDDDRDESEQQEYEEENLTREFQLKLLSDDEGDDSVENRNKRFGRSSYQSSLPTVQHCSYDARPLTSEEIAMHRQLLVNSTLGVRVQGPT